MSQTLSDFLKAEALKVGFDSARITSTSGIPHAPKRLQDWLQAGYHGSMTWMESRAEQRASPALLWPDVRSVLLVGMNYAPDHDPMADLGKTDIGVISVYAQGHDYHDVIKAKLKELARAFVARSGSAVKVFVDTAPVMEKTLSEAAGLGWQGKHTALVSRTFGSWLFLGAIYTDADLQHDAPERDHCGRCRRCLDVCPTNAFPAPYVLDARRCVSYLTIEHKGLIPHELRAGIGNRIYGCDDCLAVCPWNKFAQSAREQKLSARKDLVSPSLEMFLSFDDAQFRQFFAKTPIKRIGRNRFIRNVLIAVGNTRTRACVPHVQALLSDDDPVVRGSAVWALKQLVEPYTFLTLKQVHSVQEMDAEVLAEWKA